VPSGPGSVRVGGRGRAFQRHHQLDVLAALAGRYLFDGAGEETGVDSPRIVLQMNSAVAQEN
jgi:hypothetical protein